MSARTKRSAATGRLALLLLLAGAWSGASAAGLIEVTQTIFGMDCAPCAHGIQKDLMKLAGVSNATVSLNDGYARVELTEDNTVSLDRIRAVVRENGFTPKQAHVIVAGRLSRSGGRTELRFGGQRFLLAVPHDAGSLPRTLEDAPSGAWMKISGQVAEANPERILVSDAEPIE